MSDFPKLISAFTVQIAIDAPITVGAVSKGAPLVVVPFAPNSGSIRSEPNYPIKIDAVFAHGSDFIRQDPSGKHVRLDVNSTAKDKSGAILSYKYSGIINLTPGISAVLGGAADAKTTPFGNTFAQVLIETGSEELRAVEQKVYVASGRFVIEAGKPTVVEYKVSEVAA